MNKKHADKEMQRKRARRATATQEVIDYVELLVNDHVEHGLFLTNEAALALAQLRFPGAMHADGLALLATVQMQGARMHDLYRAMRARTDKE